jgi:hypothetical protein
MITTTAIMMIAGGGRRVRRGWRRHSLRTEKGSRWIRFLIPRLFEKSIFVHVRGEGYRRIPLAPLFSSPATLTQTTTTPDEDPAGSGHGLFLTTAPAPFSPPRPPPRGTITIGSDT